MVIDISLDLYLSWKIPDKATAMSKIINAPQKNPNLKVVHGDPCLSPRGGTLSLLIAFFLFPPSSWLINVSSVSRERKLSMFNEIRVL